MGIQQSNSNNLSQITGLRVLKIIHNSPGFKAGIEPFFDFIIALEINNKEVLISDLTANILEENSILSRFFEIIKECQNKRIGFTLYNIYSQQKRCVKIIPSKDWPYADSLLGILIRNEEIYNALERTFKVLKVLDNSPAFMSGLIPEQDYILGMTYFKYKDIQDFKELLTQEISPDSTENIKEICVFNTKSQEIRYTVLKMKKDWGGQGMIGCEFGFGILNQLKPGLENIRNESEITENEENKTDKSPIKQRTTSFNMKSLNNSSAKLRVPPKNPFNYPSILKKPSFEKAIFDKEKNEKDFLEIEFQGIPKYENPPSKEEYLCEEEKNMQKIEKKTSNMDISEIRSNNSSFLMGSVLENDKTLEKSMEKSEFENIPGTAEIKENKSKIITKYSFFAKKINGDYVINSSDLFKTDITLK